MIGAAEVHPGMILLIADLVYKVVSVDFRRAAKSERIVHLKLKSIPGGVTLEKRLTGSDRVKEVKLD